MAAETKLEYNKPFILQRADPYVYRHTDGYYYFTATVPAYDKIILRKAKTFSELANAFEYTIWEKHKTGEMGAHIWAPELHYINGKWYIYFAAGAADEVWKIRPFVLACEAEDPTQGEFIELGQMQAAEEDEFSFQAFSLDATVFEHKGENYFVWAEKVGVGKMISNLYIAKMESPVKLKTVQVLLTTPDYDWERRGFWVNEGPFVLKKNGKLFLTYSASDTSSNYCVGMLTVNEDSDLLDPKNWEKSRYPVLKTSDKAEIYGPGHNCFTQSEDGTVYMIYHARTVKDIAGDPLHDPNRHTMVLEVQWSAEERPVFSADSIP